MQAGGGGALRATHASLESFEADCIGVDAHAAWHLHSAVVGAAEKALVRHTWSVIEAAGPKEVGFGSVPYSGRQSLTAGEVAQARAVLMHTVAPDGGAGLGGGGSGRGSAAAAVDAALSTILSNCLR